MTKVTGGKIQKSSVSAVGVSKNNPNNVYYGVSGPNAPYRTELHNVQLERISVHEQLKISYPDEYMNYGLTNCAETSIFSQALANGERIDDILIYPIKIKTGLYHPPCLNCQKMYVDAPQFFK